MNRQIQRAMAGLAGASRFAETIPFTGQEATVFSAAVIAQYMCGNLAAFTVGVGALSKVERMNEMKKEVIGGVMEGLQPVLQQLGLEPAEVKQLASGDDEEYQQFLAWKSQQRNTG